MSHSIEDVDINEQMTVALFDGEIVFYNRELITWITKEQAVILVSALVNFIGEVKESV